ncbi:penicillin-binding protein 1A [Spiribacter pallidus]|uniref:penicillin-binding protein 1A n=1 Tax=Spiribacter pallidus TaxID=1987936 RepID=UPI00349FDF52
MSRIIRLSLQAIAGLAALALLAGAGLVMAYILLAPSLPSVEEVRSVELQVPLRVYTRDGELIDEFGQMRRTPVSLANVPTTLQQAFIAAEDQRFYVHPGVDYQGIIRAVWYLVRTGEKGPGGSTITMQLARNLFLTAERTYLRKLREILLALRIEQELEKATILELYLNKIYLGQRAYGVAAAAEVYYGKPLAELTLAQQAMIAGLPKAPSAWNPLANPERALQRRAYVLGRMRESGFIQTERYEQAMAAPITATYHGRRRTVDAPFVAEMARAWMVDRYGQQAAYTGGYELYTTVTRERQRAARQALRDGLHAYDERHGYRGVLDELSPELLEADREQLLARLDDYNRPGDLAVGLVEAVDGQQASLLLHDGQRITLGWAGLSWARAQLGRNAMGPNPEAADDVLVPGDVVYLRQAEGQWRLAQVPEPQAALVSLDPETGRMEALVGGYDFARSKFNRATQAARQPGSSFKPLIYSAALANGLTPATLVNDAPVVFPDASLEDVWRPENYSGRVFGPTRLREALTFSRNLVSIRVLRRIGVDAAIEHIRRFGVPGDQLPRNLSLALGSAEITPMALARAYAVFANGGYRVKPYLVERVVDNNGVDQFRAWPRRAAEPEAIRPAEPGRTGPQRPAFRPAERAISAENAWLMRSMLRDVVERGTARSARALGRGDIAGKTGTTNEQRDAWFSGFNGDLVSTVWVGFDELQTLGRYETGGRAALPIWMDYMDAALQGIDETEWPRPEGLVTVRIDPETGERVGGESEGAVFETFRRENVPSRSARAQAESRDGDDAGSEAPIF